MPFVLSSIQLLKQQLTKQLSSLQAKSAPAIIDELNFNMSKFFNTYNKNLFSESKEVDITLEVFVLLEHLLKAGTLSATCLIQANVNALEDISLHLNYIRFICLYIGEIYQTKIGTSKENIIDNVITHLREQDVLVQMKINLLVMGTTALGFQAFLSPDFSSRDFWTLSAQLVSWSLNKGDLLVR